MKPTPRLVLLFSLALGFAGLASPARASLTVYPAPAGAPSNTDYSVRVRQGSGAWQNLYEYKVEVNSGHGGGGNGTGYPTTNSSMVHFDFSGTVEVEVTSNWAAISSVRVRPSAAGIALSGSGNVRTFTLTAPDKLSFEVNGNIYRNLHIMADPPAPAVPAGAVEFAPGNHQPPSGDYIETASNTTYYLHGGAILRGGFRVDGKTNVKIMGRGIVLVEPLTRPNSPQCVNMRDASFVTVDGVILLKYYDYPGAFGMWCTQTDDVTIKNTKIITASRNGDGIDLMACQRFTIDDCFVRSSDDSIAIYASRPDFSFGPLGDTRDITVKNSTLWADVAHPFQIGTHGSQNATDRDIIERIRGENLDILEHDCSLAEFQGCLSINSGDENIIRNITFSDIRISDFTEGQVFNVRVIKNSYNPLPGKTVQGVIFRNVSYTGSGDAASVIDGYASDRLVNGVLFDNCTRNGAAITDGASCNLSFGDNYANVTFNNHLLNPSFESGTTNWSSDSGVITSITSPVYFGSKAAQVSNRTSAGQGGQQSVLGILNAFGQGTYYLQAAVRLGTGTGTAQVRLYVKIGGVWSAVATVSGAVNASGYTLLSGTANAAWSGTLEAAVFKIITTAGTADLLIDSCVLKKN